MTKQETKQVNKQDIDRKVERLIKVFNDIQEEYIKKSRTILLKIVDLRRIQNSKYSYQDLENEEDLEEHKDKIKYFVKYADLNTRTMKLETEGKISSVDTMLIANLPKKMVREEQDKIVDKVISGEITKKELVEASPSVLYRKIGDNYNAMEEDLKAVLRIVYNLDEIAKAIQDYPHILKQKKYRDLFEEKYNKLTIVVKNTLRKW